MRRPRALVLTAGLGTRLRPLTDVRAKAAVPVNGLPLAFRVARWLAAHGFDDQIFNLHHLPHTITAALGDGAPLGARIRYSWEREVLGSAGGPRRALPLLTDGGLTQALLVNGDTLTDLDLDGLLERHAASGASVTMALIPNPNPAKYGGVVVDDGGFVSGFTRPGSTSPSFHFIGVQAIETQAFEQLEDGVKHESVGALYPALMQANARAVAAFISGAAFQDIGTPADCLETSLRLAESEGNQLIGSRADIADDVVLERCALWDDVRVERGVRLTECIVGDGASVPAGLSLARCAVVPAGSRPPAPDERVEHGLLIRPFQNPHG